MWIYTTQGVLDLSLSREPGRLRVRSHQRTTLQRLARDLPDASIRMHDDARYRYSVEGDRQAVLEALSAMMGEIDYRRLSDVVEASGDAARRAVYEQVDSVTRKLAGHDADPGGPRDANPAAVATAAAALGRLTLQSPRRGRALTVFFLGSSDAMAGSGEPSCELLATAIEGQRARVAELPDPVVEEIQLTSRSAMPILAMEGEVLKGAQQDRMVNATVLVGADSECVISVSCVEQSRWSAVSDRFFSRYRAPTRLRSDVHRYARQSRRIGREALSDQGAVWQDVQRRRQRASLGDNSSSLSGVYENLSERLEAERATFGQPDGAVGVLVASGTQVLAMEVFDSPANLQTAWPMILDACLVEAIEAPETDATPEAVAQAFVRDVAARLEPIPRSVGIGDPFEVADGPINGSGLCHDDRLIHFVAFPEPAR